MDEQSHDNKPGSGANRFSAQTPLKTIAIGYGVVVLFLAIFFVLLAFGGRLNKSISEPRWALVLALLAILPLFLPLLTAYVFPRITTLKISGLMEVSLAKAEIISYSLADLTAQLRGIAEGVSAAEYASMMTSYSSVIVDMIRNVRLNGDAVVVVDLGDGTKWIPPNLFILARLARDYTSLRLIGFTETRTTPGAFVGMCSPAEIVDGLGLRFPALMQAASQLPDIDQPPTSVASSFFNSLSTLYGQSPEVVTVKDMWLNGPLLGRLMAASMYTDRVEWTDPLPESDSRYILECKHPYVAAVCNEQLQFFIERDRFALMISRQMIRGR